MKREVIEALDIVERVRLRGGGPVFVDPTIRGTKPDVVLRAEIERLRNLLIQALLPLIAADGPSFQPDDSERPTGSGTYWYRFTAHFPGGRVYCRQVPSRSKLPYAEIVQLREEVAVYLIDELPG